MLTNIITDRETKLEVWGEMEHRVLQHFINVLWFISKLPNTAYQHCTGTDINKDYDKQTTYYLYNDRLSLFWLTDWLIFFFQFCIIHTHVPNPHGFVRHHYNDVAVTIQSTCYVTAQSSDKILSGLSKRLRHKKGSPSEIFQDHPTKRIQHKQR